MTLRARPSSRRPHRTGVDADTRRNLYINIGFGLVIVAAVLVLAGAAFATWYADHLVGVGSVNGESISRDRLLARADIEMFRLQELYTRTTNDASLGRISDAVSQQRISIINQRAQAIDTVALEGEIDTTLIFQLGRQRGVSATRDKIDARLAKEATSPAVRHAWVISVTPEVSTGATEPTAAQKDAASKEAAKLQADLAAGTVKWEDAVKSSDDAYAAGNGDLSYLTAEATTPDAAFVAAAFALPANGVTPVVEGKDGSFRIGRVTDIVAARTDAAFEDRIAEAGISLDDYRRVVESEVIRDEIDAQLQAEVVDTASSQRRVSEIYIADSGTGSTSTANEVRSSHILYSPNDNPDAASSLAADDPAWKKAEDEAKAAYEKLKAGTADFATLAKEESDDTGSGATGGDLGYYSPESSLDQAYADAIFAQGRTKGELLPPVKSSFGWHVIKIVDIRASASVRIDEASQKAKAAGADFAALAKEYSEGPEAAKGGDIGWVARYQLDKDKETAIFALQAGQVSDVITTADGSYLYKVVTVENRKPDEDQAAELRDTVFNNWYLGIKNDPAQTTIDRGESSLVQG